VTVWYNQCFFSINGEDYKNLKLDNFVAKLNAVLEATDKNYNGDRLYVVFRDSFFACTGLIKGD